MEFYKILKSEIEEFEDTIFPNDRLNEMKQSRVEILSNLDFETETQYIILKKFVSEDFNEKIYILENLRKYIKVVRKKGFITIDCDDINEKIIDFINQEYSNECFENLGDLKVQIEINNTEKEIAITFYQIVWYFLKNNLEINDENIYEYGVEVEWNGGTSKEEIHLNKATARSCYKYLIENENPDGYFAMGKMYYRVYTTREIAIEYFQKAIELGYEAAMIEMALINKRNKDLDKFIEYLTMAEKIGSKTAKEIRKEYNQELELDKLADEVIEKYMERTQKSCLEMVLEDGNIEILDSKISGNPYLPENEEYPISKDGTRMALLIQINFEEIELAGYPQKGIFQIFSNQNFYENEFKIKYYKNVEEKYQTEFPKCDLSEFIIKEPKKIKFNISSTCMPLSNKDSGNILKEVMSSFKRKTGLRETVEAKISTQPGLMGGYPDFCQKDIRTNKKMVNYTENFIKIDENLDKKLTIGDAGIINVLMTKEDFESGNFENVVVYWDCM